MSDSADKSNASPAAHVVLLRSFTVLFALRVTAQLVQWVRPTPFLPRFDAWQGSGLDYPVLLTSQLLILALMGWGIRAVHGGAHGRKSVGRWLIVLGVLYFGSMSARLVLGLTVLSDFAWFSKPLPALFHLVVAGYVLTLGHYHSRETVVPNVS
jgi:hypothetical protein